MFAIIFIACTTLLTSCKKDETPPILSVPFVDVGRIVTFINFGAPHPVDSSRDNPNYDVHVDGPDVKVFSASEGIIERINWQEEDSDYELEVQPYKNSIYKLIYDHVRNLPPNIVKGAKLYPGDELGTVGGSGGVGGHVELQINSNSDRNVISHCPKQFGTEAFNNAMEEACNKNGLYPDVCLKETAIP